MPVLNEESKQSVLLDIFKRGFALAISDFVIYELLQGAPITKEAERIKWLKMFTRYPVDQSVLVASAQLKTLYDMEKIPPEQIRDGDKIIAATAILKGSLILTANVNDFPRPFFIEREINKITYQFKGRYRMIPTYILSPNYPVIDFRFANRPK